MSGTEGQADSIRLDGSDLSAVARQAGDGEVEMAALGGGGDEWPPASYADNDHILVWWLPDYDEVLRQSVADYQWAWRGVAVTRLEPLIPKGVLRAWRDSDPQCQEYSWHNVLYVFAAARAKQLGISPRPGLEKVCSCCSVKFLESHLSHVLIDRVGTDAIDVCPTCLFQALHPGSRLSSPDTVIAVLQALSAALARPLKTSDLSARMDLRSLSTSARAAVVQALRVKPTAARVKELFGSWDAALAQASEASPIPVPKYQRPTQPHQLPVVGRITACELRAFLLGLGRALILRNRYWRSF